MKVFKTASLIGLAALTASLVSCGTEFDDTLVDPRVGHERVALGAGPILPCDQQVRPMCPEDARYWVDVMGDEDICQGVFGGGVGAWWGPPDCPNAYTLVSRPDLDTCVKSACISATQ